jgi:hypothetical protein
VRLQVVALLMAVQLAHWLTATGEVYPVKVEALVFRLVAEMD